MKRFLHAGSFAVVLAALLWSVDGLLRRTLFVLPPSVVVFWEHILGVLVLIPVIAVMWKKFPKLTKKQWWSITFVALLSGALGTILYTSALGQVQYIPFSVVVLLQQLNPIFAILAAALLLKEKLSPQFLLLSAIAFVGAYLVSFPDLSVNLSTGNGTLVAALLAVGAAAAWGVATAFSKYALKGTSYIHVTALRFGLTVPFALLFVVGSGSASSLGSLSWEQFVYLVAITFSTGLVSLVIYYFGLQRVAASRAAVLELAWPLSAVLVGWLWLSQGLTLTQGIGAIILTATTLQIARSTRETPNGQDVRS